MVELLPSEPLEADDGQVQEAVELYLVGALSFDMH